MISSFEVNNFKCLANVKLNLGPFNVFIGPNDSGKSSVLDALHLLGQTVNHPLSEVFSGSHSLLNLLWKNARNSEITWATAGTADGESFDYRLILSDTKDHSVSEQMEFGQSIFALNASGVQATIQFGSEQVRPLAVPPTGGTAFYSMLQGWGEGKIKKNLRPMAQTLASSIKYCLEPKSPRTDSVLTPNPELDPCGNNLPSVLDTIMTGPDRSAILDIEKYLHQTIPTIAGISVLTMNQPNNARKSLQFVLTGTKPPMTIPAALASDGALLTTAFLALVYGNTPAILLVEEPENGLHPSRLKLVIDLLRKASTGEVGNRPRQVIITTHSPVLLNYVKPEEVTIFRRTETGETQVTPMSAVPGIDSLLSDYGVGELWYLLGEEGLLKEQPA